jgi:hypothetical protein
MDGNTNMIEFAKDPLHSYPIYLVLDDEKHYYLGMYSEYGARLCMLKRYLHRHTPRMHPELSTARSLSPLV